MAVDLLRVWLLFFVMICCQHAVKGQLSPW